MKKILLTAAGTGTAFSYVTAIKKNFPDINVYTADTNSKDYITSALFSTKHFIVPLSTDKTYRMVIERILKEENIDFYLPVIDSEIKMAYESDFLVEKLISNHLEFCLACINKNAYHTWSSDLGINTPLLISKENIELLDTVVIKKNGGFGGRGTEIINTKEIHKFDVDDYSIYEHINGEEYTIDCYPFKKDVITTIRKRIEVKSGVCVKAEIKLNTVLTEMALKITKYFNINYPFCFQVIEKNSVYYLIDVNPRLGAGTLMGAVTGKDYFSAHIASILNQDPKEYLITNIENCIVTRQYANYLTKVL